MNKIKKTSIRELIFAKDNNGDLIVIVVTFDTTGFFDNYEKFHKPCITDYF